MAHSMLRCFALSLIMLGFVHEIQAFLKCHPASHVHGIRNKLPTIPQDTSGFISPNDRLYFLPQIVQNQRRSVAPIQTSGLFGLGFGEIAVVLVVVGFVLGPKKIGNLITSSSNRAQDLSEEIKKVPEEFQKGMEEGESDVRARKAKRIRVLKDDE
mmetsp:Transcript_10742/g.14223  ORF Transcript_10742/g.14223 Transcript_10742/m.14223 type:complete len:156 (-) Transcript_10742:280-747(-)